jgi:hypothetical protein
MACRNSHQTDEKGCHVVCQCLIVQKQFSAMFV